MPIPSYQMLCHVRKLHEMFMRYHGNKDRRPPVTTRFLKRLKRLERYLHKRLSR